MKRLRVYADTSVFGGCFDEEFDSASKAFFSLIAEGQFSLLVSALTAEELLDAPSNVRAVVDQIPAEFIEYHEITDEMERLCHEYLAAGVLTDGSEADALHVAAATVLDADILVSWNFKHIVQYRRIRGFNAVNRLKGYRTIEIFSPLELIES